jgi:molybdopterin synthase catalytic subunit
MRVRVLFFGMLKDLTGISGESLELQEPVTLDSLWLKYADRFPRLSEYRSHIRFARNHEFADDSAVLAEGDEIAFMPPVCGGKDPDPLVYLTRDSIDTRGLVSAVQRGDDGAVVTFEGVVRNNTKGRPTLFLDYECYEEMALKLMRGLAEDLKEKHPIGLVAVVHRLGRLQIGEASVVIAVSAPHRKAAFEAAFEGINRLKSSVPIWKKEHFADGEVWVEGEWGS